MADIWYSLHIEGKAEPIYVSEVAEKAMNPSFKFFDLNTYGAYVTRRDEMVVKFWTRPGNEDTFTLHLELNVNLRALQFIGKTVSEPLR